MLIENSNVMLILIFFEIVVEIVGVFVGVFGILIIRFGWLIIFYSFCVLVIVVLVLFEMYGDIFRLI